MRIVKLLLFLVSFLLVRVDVYAYDFKVNGLCYNKLSDSTVELTWEDIGKPYTGEVVVPSYISYSGKRYDIVAIGDYAFVWVEAVSKGKVNGWGINNKSFSVLLPTTITSIGQNAFASCSGLTSIKIPSSVTSIGAWAFESCSGLTSITIPNSVTNIHDAAFIGCTGLFSIKVENGNAKYDSRDNCNAIVETATNTLIIGCKNTIIPNSVTSIGELAFYDCSSLTSITIPNSVTYIGYYAFNYCSSLTSVISKIQNPFVIGNVFKNYSYDKDIYATATLTVPKGTKAAYQATEGWNKFVNIIEADGDETQSNEVFSVDGISYKIVGGNSVAVTNSGVYYTENIDIPSQVRYNGNRYNVTSIEDGAFAGCSKLPSITIPNSVMSIGRDAFFNCGLHNIVSEIENPFAIDESVFETEMNEIYEDATLTVPSGTKTKYQATDGWKKFGKIVEAGEAEIEFTSDGVTYLGSNSNKMAVVNSVDTKQRNLEIPASVSYNGTSYQVTGIADNAFSGCTLAALIWNADAALPSNAFSSASIGSNFLLYVKSESYAPSSVKNIIVNGTAQTIVLSDDGGQFYCPQSFTARSISYTHNYSMETGGSGMGWETIALPFNVQKVSHSSRGEIVPFASYNGGSNQKPFWLASMVSSGFRSSSSIQANTPYIIAMPNNSSYRNDYILAGDVTFSAENVNVPVTPTFSGFFVPAYSTIAKSASVYALNVRNRYVTNTGNYVAGSRFISNLRDVRPFEAYLSVGSSTRGVIEIGFSDGTTGMADVIGAFDADRPIDIYTLSGQKVAQTKQSEIDNILNQLPHGVYIVNGKKIVK